MVEQTKRKKHHDKDKYYHLAKEQGFRSRAAFKLTQINRKFNLLQNARTVLDLCAAPGGWTQVCARTLPTNSTILAVDILPLRTFHSPNVMRLLGDITTHKCQAAIRAELQGVGVDVVLCDGAPNVGASYDRDAYQQNELALHALKCASDHLRKNGTFVTKLYRSTDYSAYLWVAKKFFQTVQAVKPAASRTQSAEIFLVCQGYLAPEKIDARMFDPKCVFEQVDGQATGGGDKAQTGEKTAKIHIFHKDFGKQVRSRNGYDFTNLDASMRNIGSVVEFLEGGSISDPIRLLSECTGLAFVCQVCKEVARHETPSCRCREYLENPLTTPEIKTCLSDLKVLNKGDFKGLLLWREKIRAERKAASPSDDSSSDKDDEKEDELDSDAEDEKVQVEIEELRKKKIREKKRLKKKERELAAKRRQRAAYGMDLNAIDVPDSDKIFSLATITSAGDLEAVREIDLDKVTDDQIFPTEDSEEEEGALDTVESKKYEHSPDDNDEYNYSLEEELDAAYNRYLANTKDGMAKSGTRMGKRTKKLQKLKALEEAREDMEMISEKAEEISADAKAYAKMLEGAKESDDSTDCETEDEGSIKDKNFVDKGRKTREDLNVSSDASDADQGTALSHGTRQLSNTNEAPVNPLIFTLADDPASVKTSRWFSNPLFESIENTAIAASFAVNRTVDQSIDLDFSSDEDNQPTKKRRKKLRPVPMVDEEAPLNVDSIIASMPKTDKQKRHEKRLKSIERMKRRDARRERETGVEGDFKIAPASDDDEADNIDGGSMKLMNDKDREKLMDARALIKAGIGTTHEKDTSGFEVVPTSLESLPIIDTRKYDSENEDYDSDDMAKTLALGTMILRKSKERAFVDASYNRFAWNDPEDLPDWFVDDENKNYRPQLPIPPELLEKMRLKFLHLATKPIAKVAEARARKSKMARAKLAAAKKKAAAVANSSEMSEAMKLKAISKAMRGKEVSQPGKTYVVSKKNGASRGGKGIKLVDKREKNDKRANERIRKKKKFGKKGGLTGNKKRRHHK